MTILRQSFTAGNRAIRTSVVVAVIGLSVFNLLAGLKIPLYQEIANEVSLVSPLPTLLAFSLQMGVPLRILAFLLPVAAIGISFIRDKLWCLSILTLCGAVAAGEITVLKLANHELVYRVAHEPSLLIGNETPESNVAP